MPVPERKAARPSLPRRRTREPRHASDADAPNHAYEMNARPRAS